MTNMTNAEYHGNKALGASLIKEVLINAKKFKKLWDRELEVKSKNLDIGSALHKLVLEPETFNEEFAVAPVVNKRTKAGKEEWKKFEEENQNKVILISEDLELVKSMKEKLLKLPNFEIWLKNGVAEKSFFCNIDGVDIKCRPDLLVKTKKGYVVIDLKTMSSEATPSDFAKTSANFLYHLQEAVYREVLEANGIKVIDFIFAGVSKLDYSGAGYFRHDISAVDLGKELMQKALFKFKWCLDNNQWEESEFDFINGGFEKITSIMLPNWAWYQF